MKLSSSLTAPEPVAALIGLDWGDETHAICLQPTAGGPAEPFALANTPEALHGWLGELGRRFAWRPVAIALEKTRAMVLDMLLQVAFVRVYPVHPAAVDHYRQSFGGSRAKSDPRDAAVLLHLLAHRRAELTVLRPDDPATRQLAALCEERRHVVDQRTKRVQELRAKLKRYFPQALSLVGEDLASAMACALLSKWPTMGELQRARPATVRRFYYVHHCRSEARITARLGLIREAVVACPDPAVEQPLVLAVQTLVGEVRVLLRAIGQFDRAIAKLFAAHPDKALFAELPGAGSVLAPRLLAGFGSDRSRYPTVESLQCYSGIAPVTQQSGGRWWIHFRWQRPRFLHQTFVEFANASIRFSRWAAAYARYRRAKDPHINAHVIDRALAFKWLRILHACWQQRQPYDEQQYIAALQRSGSPICAYLEPAS